MKTYPRDTAWDKQDQRQGAAMVIVLCLAGVMLLAATSIMMITGSMARKATKIGHGVEALSIAEAGVADVLEQMGTNYSAMMDTVYTSSFAGGVYVVSTKTDIATGNVTIWSEGTVGDQDRTTVVELLGDANVLNYGALGAGDAMLAEGDITLETAAMDINGSVHANQNVLHTRGNTQIDGPVSACGIIQLPSPTTGFAHTPSADELVVPDFQPFDEWKDAAIAGGIYYSSSVSLRRTDLRPANGVVYVDGDVSLANRSSIVGTLVASGTITINNRLTHSAFNTNWPAMLAGMDVNINNRNSYYGAIFAGNDISSYNRRNVEGALVALNNIYVQNGLVINPLTQTPYWSPNQSNAPPPEVNVGGWLR